MVHLSIAKSILDKTPEIVKPSQLVLGSIAPDSVHFRSNYLSEMKKASHFMNELVEQEGLISPPVLLVIFRVSKACLL